MGAGTARALFVLESLDALIVKGTALLAHRDMADAQSLSNHHVRLSFPTGQNNLGALHQAVTQAAGTGHGLLLLFLFLTKADGHGGATNGHGPTPCTAFPPILSTSLPGPYNSWQGEGVPVEKRTRVPGSVVLGLVKPPSVIGDASGRPAHDPGVWIGGLERPLCVVFIEGIRSRAPRKKAR